MSLNTENLDPVPNLAEAIRRLQAIAQADSIAGPDKALALTVASALTNIDARLKVLEQASEIRVSDTPQAGAQSQSF
jgi:hypothetical protein